MVTVSHVVKLRLNLFKEELLVDESFRNTYVNNPPFEMHLQGHNFSGPGTKRYKRLNSDGRPREWSIPINRVDNAAYHHDLCYSKHDDTKTRI